MNDDKAVNMGQFAILAVLIAVIVSAVMLIFMPRSTEIVSGASAAGTTFNTAKVALVSVSFASGTSTSVLNGDANDRYVKTLDMACSGVGASQTAYTGVGLATTGWRIAASTSTSAASSAFVNANGNYVFNASIATSTAIFTISSTTATTAMGGAATTTVWAAGTYLDIFTNATNTAQCAVGVSYIAS